MAQHKFAIDDRVVVIIADPESYAKGSFESLNMKSGTVIGIKDDYGFEPEKGPGYLVRFDTLPKKWWTNQMPGRDFWFTGEDLE